jgi:hypothetical protein
MEFKLFNQLLMEADIDKKRHVYNTEDEHGNVHPNRHIQFDKYETTEESLDVYGDKSVVIKYKVNWMNWYNHKKEGNFSHGINTMDIESINILGKPIFTAKGNKLPYEGLAKWDGNEEDVQNLGPGIEQVMDDYKEEGNQDAVVTYMHAIQEKPTLWNDIAKALVEKYHELDSADPVE